MQDPAPISDHRDGAQRTLDAGSLVIGAGAVALLISLFLDWYGDPNSSQGVTAWRSFEIIDLLLAAIAVLALVAVGERLAGLRPRVPLALAGLAGPVALVLVLASIIEEPPLLIAFGADPSREVGIWIALAAALVMTAGALLRNVRVSLVVAPRETPRTSPDDETRPMPEEPPYR